MAAGHADAEAAAVGHRVAGVDGQVEEGVLELVGVHQGVEFLGGQVEPHGDALGEGARQQRGHVMHQGAHLDGARGEGLLAREGEQAADQLGAAAGRRQGRVEVVLEALVGRELVPQRGQVAGDDGEQVVEVVGEAAGELADGFHLLGLDQHRLAGLLLGDVDGQHEEALHAAGLGGFRHHRAAGVHLLAGGVDAGIFVAHLLAGVGLLELRPDLGVGVGPDHLEDALADDALLVEAEPVGVAPVGETVAFAGVHVGDHRRDGVEDAAHALLAAGELAGQVVEAGLGGFEFGGAGAHAVLQLGVLALDEALVAALLGDVGPQGDEAQVGDRHAADRQHLAVGPGALGLVGLEGAHRGHPLGDQALHLGRVEGPAAVLAPLHVEAHELLEGRADPHQRLGEIQQAQHGLVPGDQLGGGVEHRDGLVEQVEAGQQQVVAA